MQTYQIYGTSAARKGGRRGRAGSLERLGVFRRLHWHVRKRKPGFSKKKVASGPCMAAA